MTSNDEESSQSLSSNVNFDTMSIDDLHEYIADMTTEIEKVKLIIKKKLAAQDTADSFFKK
ncbi:DUF1192 domain-containing protein [Sneathiella marina]|uniref:DUF1192 domain-containing protein n=1 Tax=Sneathiella marina TaxID=2950108 RepID=A0ABY4W5C5_9PROT|nr:DUF1192 domain-containing protein [Sneathiella marina]USG62398.1 DUF1192 domain-containing protein [Sneathiella marina]